MCRDAESSARPVNVSRAKSFNARRQTRRHLGTRARNPRRLGSGHFVITCTSLLPLRNGNAGEPLAQSDVSSFVRLGDMKKAARTTERALISRARQIFSIRRRLAFLRELERRLKEKAAVLDAYKPARRSPSLAVCSSYHASSASQRLAATGPLTGGGMRAAPSPDRSQATSPWAQRPIDSIPADIHNPVAALAPETRHDQAKATEAVRHRSGEPVGDGRT